MLRIMGLLKELRRQLIGRRPVKHETYGAAVEGPDRTVVAIALDGVTAVQAIASAVPGPAATSRQWASPPIARLKGELPVSEVWFPQTW